MLNTQKNKSQWQKTETIGSGSQEVVIIGDSWSEGENVRGFHTWTYYLEQETDWTVHNYSMGGSLVSGDVPNWNLDGNLSGEVKAAVNDAAYDPCSVNLVILEGGINDFRHGIGAETIAESMKKHKEILQKRFTRAQFICFLNYQSIATEALMQMLSSLRSKLEKVMPCYSMAGWIPPGCWNTADYIHPSEKGYQIVMKNILAVLNNQLPQCWPSLIEFELRKGESDFCRIELTCSEGLFGRLFPEIEILEEGGTGCDTFQGLKLLCTGDRLMLTEQSQIRISTVQGHLWCWTEPDSGLKINCREFYTDESGQLKSFCICI